MYSKKYLLKKENYPTAFTGNPVRNHLLFRIPARSNMPGSDYSFLLLARRNKIK